MGGGGAINILYKREIEQSADPGKTRQEKIAEFTERFERAFEALSKQFAEAAIRPSETRKRLIESLEILRGKKEERPRKKHGVMPCVRLRQFHAVAGSEKQKVAPLPSVLSTQIRPPWASTIILQMTKPRPVPLSLKCFTLPPCRYFSKS